MHKFDSKKNIGEIELLKMYDYIYVHQMYVFKLYLVLYGIATCYY